MDIRTRYFEVHASRYNIGIGSGASVWFRLFGYGIFARVNPPEDPRWLYFSERECKAEVFRIGRLVLGRVTPIREA